LTKYWDFSRIKEWTWREHPLGAVIPEASTTDRYETGGWRSLRPVRDPDKCVHCHICFIFCPDSSILVADGKMTGFNLQHCKGCGICAEECPKTAITMISEADAQRKEKCLLPENGQAETREEKGA
jgi:pyruvate ferredoxin oxidoreductase delta subunit